MSKFHLYPPTDTQLRTMRRYAAVYGHRWTCALAAGDYTRVCPADVAELEYVRTVRKRRWVKFFMRKVSP